MTGTAPPAAAAAPVAVATPAAGRPGPARRLQTRLGRRAPYVVLAASLLLTTVAAAIAGDVGRRRAAAEFETAVQAATDRVRSHLAAYETLLAGSAGLFAADANGRVSEGQFRAYVARLDLPRRFPGVRGVGYTALVWRRGGRPYDPDAALAAARALGSRAPAPWPDPLAAPRAEVHAIVYLEPDDEANRAALGYDMYAEPTRRAAMDRARDRGGPAASGRVTLVQERLRPDPDGREQPGFLVYVPVYRGGAVPATLELRRRELAGYVYAPFRGSDLLRGAFGRQPPTRVEFRIFDGADTTGTSAIADSRVLAAAGAGDPAGAARPPGRTRRLVTLDVAGRPWTLAFADPAHRPGAAALLGGAGEALAVGAFGVLVSVALTLVTAAEVRARVRVEESDTLRARFFAAMSHELRTPVNAVLGYNDLLLAGVYGPLADEQREAIVRGQRAARHLHELVNDVLDLSKLEAGKMDVSLEPVSLAALLDDLRVTIGPLADERGCALEVDAHSCDVALHTDPRRLRQILLNLLSNATKFGAGRPVHVWCDRRARRVAVHVRDAGPGIAPADQVRVFEEFVQLPGNAPGGTGLGLPISRRLAELLGGTLTVESAPGAGSTFTVLLPAGAALRTPPRGTPAQPVSAQRPGRA